MPATAPLTGPQAGAWVLDDLFPLRCWGQFVLDPGQAEARQEENKEKQAGRREKRLSQIVACRSRSPDCQSSLKRFQHLPDDRQIRFRNYIPRTSQSQMAAVFVEAISCRLVSRPELRDFCMPKPTPCLHPCFSWARTWMLWFATCEHPEDNIC